ncbi:MAG: hypothetical protein ACK6CU_20450 [Deltaproteobacteria bacterium]|jgi:hypothetical protein
MERAPLPLVVVSSLALLGCGSALSVVRPGPPASMGSANVRDTGARPTPAVIADAIDREGSVRGLIDPQRGLVVVSAYTDEDGEVRRASRQCAAELSRTVRTLDAHLGVDDEGALRCTADTCKDPSLRENDPNRLFVFRPDPRRGVVLEAVMLLGDVGLSERGLESELAWGRAQIEMQRSAACSD